MKKEKEEIKIERLVTAKIINENKYITGFYYCLVPFHNKITQFIYLTSNSLKFKEKLFKTHHYILEQINIDKDLFSIKSYPIDINTMHEATSEEIEKYKNRISHLPINFL